ncbi:MAG TPA: hypothetical protein VER08_11685, partial [Pyrinomonadaceae bacterium]|nr:hypothetical protein [Pyrinomonadaceae bacterium]
MSAKADDSRARRPRGRERRRAKLPTPRASLACLAALVALLASCAAAQSDRRTHARDDTASHVAPAPSPTQTPSPAETPAASRTPAPDKDGGAGGTMFDYRREHAAPPPQLPASELRQVLRVVNAPRGRDTYEVNSVARGSFTEPRAAEVVYLLQPGGAAGAGPAGTK